MVQPVEVDRLLRPENPAVFALAPTRAAKSWSSRVVTTPRGAHRLAHRAGPPTIGDAQIGATVGDRTAQNAASNREIWEAMATDDDIADRGTLCQTSLRRTLTHDPTAPRSTRSPRARAHARLTTMTLTLDQLLKMSNDDLFAVVQRGHAVEADAVADTTYTGIDLSMPPWFHRLMWKSFRKTFHRDPVSGRIRGWNVKVEQTGWDTPPAPKLGAGGRPITFGHYELRSAAGLRFPRGWNGATYIDYRVAGNRAWDFPANAGYCPLVSVNPGSAELLLGWEVFNVGGVPIPINDFWVLKREGRLAEADIVPRPDGKAPQLA